MAERKCLMENPESVRAPLVKPFSFYNDYSRRKLTFIVSDDGEDGAILVTSGDHGESHSTEVDFVIEDLAAFFDQIHPLVTWFRRDQAADATEFTESRRAQALADERRRFRLNTHHRNQRQVEYVIHLATCRHARELPLVDSDQLMDLMPLAHCCPIKLCHVCQPLDGHTLPMERLFGALLLGRVPIEMARRNEFKEIVSRIEREYGEI